MKVKDLFPHSVVSIINHNHVTVLLKHEAKSIYADNECIGLYINTNFIDPLSALGGCLAFKLMNNIGINKNNSKVTIMKADSIYCNQVYTLSDEHKFVLYSMALGKSDKEIINILNQINQTNYGVQKISKMLNRTIFPKFKVHNRNELIEKIYRLNVIKSMPYLLLKCLQYDSATIN